jgi:hypothetical protein
MVTAKNILIKGINAAISDIQKTFGTIDWRYREKNVSAPSPHPKTKRNVEIDMVLIAIGIEKKSF